MYTREPRKTVQALGTLLALCVPAILSSDLSAGGRRGGSVDPNVRAACTGDYFRFCAYTIPGTASCKACFRRAGVRLSARCRSAISRSADYKHEYRRVAKKFARN